MYNDFSRPNITRESMDKLADYIEEYVDELTSMMIIPEDLLDEYQDRINEGISRAKKLIKKLRKGDTSVFNLPDD